MVLKDIILNKLKEKNDYRSLCLFLMRSKSGVLLEQLKIETNYLDIQYKYEVNTRQRIYHLINDIKDIPLCPICGKQVKWRNPNYQISCSKQCGPKLAITQEHMKRTCLERYGVEHVLQKDSIVLQNIEKWKNKTEDEIETINNKRKNTCLDKYGTDYAIQNNYISSKVKNTILNRYGNSNHCIVKMQKIILEKYGVKNTANIPGMQEKIIQACLKRYGVKYAMQNREIFDKSIRNSFKLKKYILPSGKEVKIQGYEYKFLDEYFLNGGLESNIIIENKDIESYVGIIHYHDSNSKKHRYYPDCYLISENKIIEVKSTYTRTIGIEKQELKKLACLNKGLNFEYKIY